MSSLNPDRWQEAKEIFYAALRRAPEEREQFVNESCKDDDDLRSEVESLLASHDDAQSFMERPAIGEVAEIVVKAAGQKLTEGQTVAHYQIISELGTGGQGTVYKALDAKLGRTVALKLLPQAQDREQILRFARESRTASALNHPNILTIYEIGLQDDLNFIIAEYVAGTRLREHLANGPLSPNEALDIAVQIASALTAAHEAGIVHRDIKPENIILRPDGLVKVLDFGLAKLTQDTLSRTTVDTEAPTAAQNLTKPGLVMGTVNYMSPEQARGLPVDSRTDLWSLGAVLYEMCAGQGPFAGASIADTLAAILTAEPKRVAQLNPDTPDELEEMMSKALRKDPAARYQTAKALFTDLKNLQKRLEFESEFGVPTARGSEQPAVARRYSSVIDSLAKRGNDAPNADARLQVRIEKKSFVGATRSHKLGFALVVIALLAAIGLGSYLYLERSAKQVESIAVLPFVNESGNSDFEYLSDGMTDSLITSLSQLPKLSVKAHSSVFRYKGKDTTASQLGRELNVQAILSGSVTQHDDDLTLHIELVDVKTETALWSEDYNRSMTNLVALQGEIARDVSSKLLKLTGADERQLAKRYTENSEAYQLYLKGQYEWKKHTQEDLQKSIEYFNQALQKDPNYALAYVGLSGCYGVLGNNYLPPREAFPKAKNYAAKALALDEALAEAHAGMGALRLYYDWDWAEAEKELKRAQALDPKDAEAHHLYGDYLESMGRFDEAEIERKRAQELDPLSPLYSTTVGTTLYFARRDDEAIAQLEKTINLEPRFVLSYPYLGQAYEQKKMYEQAIETFQKGMTQSERHPQLIAELGHAYAIARQPDKALKSLDELRDLSKRRYISPYLFAIVYAGLGDKDQTFAWLEKAYQDRSFFLIWLKVEPLFDPLRADPRLDSLLKRMNLVA